jgi:hypothetical protein
MPSARPTRPKETAHRTPRALSGIKLPTEFIPNILNRLLYDWRPYLSSIPHCLLDSPVPQPIPTSSHARKLVMSEIISPPLGTPGLRLTQTQKDLVGGSIGGIAQVLVGQPFDIVKVRIQTSPSGTYASPLECAKQLLKADGPRGFYKVSPHLCD